MFANKYIPIGMLANKYIPIDEAAEVADVHTVTLVSAVKRGILSLYWICGKKFLDFGEIDEFRREYTGNVTSMPSKGRKETVISEYITPRQLARKMGYKTLPPIYSRLNAGDIPAEKIGGRWVIESEEGTKWVK